MFACCPRLLSDHNDFPVQKICKIVAGMMKYGMEWRGGVTLVSADEECTCERVTCNGQQCCCCRDHNREKWLSLLVLTSERLINFGHSSPHKTPTGLQPNKKIVKFGDAPTIYGRPSIVCAST